MKREYGIKGILFAVILLCISISAGAAEEPVVYNSYTDGNRLNIFVGNIEGVESVSCQIGTVKCEDVSAKEVDQMETYLLVDNSLSIDSRYHETIREILRKLVESAAKQETITIATFDTELHYLAQKSQNQDELIQVINEITYENLDTKISDVMYSLCKVLEKDSFGGLRRIVLISDGAEYSSVGYTRQEMQAELQKLAYPVYTIGCTYRDNTKELEEMFSISRLTDASAIWLDEVNDPETIVSTLNTCSNTVEVSISISDALADGSEKGVKLDFKTADGVKSVSTVEVMPFLEAGKPADTERQEQGETETPERGTELNEQTNQGEETESPVQTEVSEETESPAQTELLLQSDMNEETGSAERTDTGEETEISEQTVTDWTAETTGQSGIEAESEIAGQLRTDEDSAVTGRLSDMQGEAAGTGQLDVGKVTNPQTESDVSGKSDTGENPGFAGSSDPQEEPQTIGQGNTWETTAQNMNAGTEFESEELRHITEDIREKAVPETQRETEISEHMSETEKAAEVSNTLSSESQEVSEPESEEAKEQQKEDPLKLPMLVVLLLLLIVFLLRRRKKNGAKKAGTKKAGTKKKASGSAAYEDDETEYEDDETAFGDSETTVSGVEETAIGDDETTFGDEATEIHASEDGYRAGNDYGAEEHTLILEEDELTDGGAKAADFVNIRLTDMRNPTRITEVPLSAVVSVGRSAKANQAVFEYEKSVSSRHCEIIRKDGNIFVRDLNSTNGTWVDDVRVEDELELYSGAVLKMGRLEVIFEIV